MQDFEKLAVLLKGEGVTIVDVIETYEYGKFLHIIDPEGNKMDFGNLSMRFTRSL